MKGISNLIFDLGGVILELDLEKTLSAFRRMVMKNADHQFGIGVASGFFKDHEAGRISDEKFIEKIRAEVTGEVSTEQITTAWNALLLHFPPERIELLKNLRSKYRLFLFSNTNGIHYARLREIYSADYPGELEDLFEKAYFSHSAGIRKPDAGAYELIIRENGIVPGESLFIDDALVNVEGAIKTGLKGLYLPPGISITDIKW